MKSCATGLSVRFFRLTIPTGARACCSFTGKTVISGLLDNRNTEVCIVRKRPVATRLSRAPGCAGEDRYARIVETAGAEDVQISRPHDAFRRGNTHGSLTSSASAMRRLRAHGLREPAMTTNEGS